MNRISTTLLSLCLAGVSAAAASLPKTALQGDYVEARTADVYTGPCFANSEAGFLGDLAVFGWRINQGSYEGVDLNGLAVMGVVKASATLGDVMGEPYPVKSVLIVDERATVEQRLALKSFAQKMAGDLLSDIVRIEYQPIRMTIDGGSVHAAKATLTAGTLAKIETRAIEGKDHICHNEQTWYQPLTKLDHAMPAFALAHRYNGTGLGTTWSSPDKRSAFVGSFHYGE